MLQAGDEAPDFSLESDEGETVTLSALRGRPVVFYFYPKDDTPGCTAQACSLRDSYGEIAALGAALYGISPDDSESHRSFRAKFGLPFPLLVDTGHAVAELLRRLARAPEREDGHPAQRVRRRAGRAPRARVLRREARGHHPGGTGGTVGMSGAAPLAGVRVLDLSRVLAGPTAPWSWPTSARTSSRSSGPGRAIRRAAWGPPFREGESAYYLCVNRGKRSVTIDLADPAGVEVVTRLALAADVVLESFLPGRRGPPRPRLRGALGREPEARLHLDRRLLARERRRAPPGLRLRDPGRGRRHVDHGRARRPAAQGRRRDRGHHDRDVRDHRHAGRAARRRADRPRPPRPGQPLRLAAGLAREPRLRLAGRRRGAAAARQRPPRHRPVRGLRDERRLRDRRHRHQRAVRALLHRGRAARAGRRRALCEQRPARRAPARARGAPGGRDPRAADGGMAGHPRGRERARAGRCARSRRPSRTRPTPSWSTPTPGSARCAPCARRSASTAPTSPRRPPRRCSGSTPTRCWPSSATTTTPAPRWPRGACRLA